MWLIYAILASVIWGLDYTLGEKIFRSKISPITLLFLQLLFGVIAFFIIGTRSNQLKQDISVLMTNTQTLWWVLLALLTFNAGNLLIFLSIQAKNATLAGLIELSYPIFTVLFSWLLFNETHLTPSVITGSLFIFAGVFIISLFN